ncbi:MAG: NAD-dependent protein deacylase [Oscillospiraceae bacterium]|nr:NAD-dependent protein deacylase [Oscillospiraceae bacterium]
MNLEQKTDKFAEYINQSNNIVFFGGAGVSTESGIPDFRSSSGIYNKNEEYNTPPEVILSHTYFFENTEKFYDFYKSKMLYLNAKPNNAHKILAKLEKKNKLKAVITQNIDNLHQEAGSKNVIELHGTVKNNFCLDCRKKFDVNYIIERKNVPYCDNCGGIIKPDVVLYEEQLNYEAVNSAINYITKADMLIVGGTSLAVYPAAYYVSCFFSDNKNTNKKSVIINKTTTDYDKIFDISINEKIGEVLKKVYSELYVDN